MAQRGPVYIICWVIAALVHALILLTLPLEPIPNIRGEMSSEHSEIEIRFVPSPPTVAQAGAGGKLSGNLNKSSVNPEKSTVKQAYNQLKSKEKIKAQGSYQKSLTKEQAGLQEGCLSDRPLRRTSAEALVHNPKPPYPAIARKRGQQGTVLLKIVVAAEGFPITVDIQRSSGYSLLDRSALNTVKKWKFIPAAQAGKPVQSELLLPVEFRLE